MPPRSIWAFASGSNAPGEIVGFARAGVPPGVAMLRWDKEQEKFKWLCGHVEARGAPRSCWRALLDVALQLRIPVFADSGAYSEFVAGKPIPPNLWRAMLADQLDLARRVGPLAVIVLPDKVADQAGTLRRIRTYKAEINAILDAGARGVAALQPGRRSDIEMAEEISSILGRRDWVVGFPTTSRARRDPAEIRDTLARFPWQPAGVHLLGIGPAAPDWPVYMGALAPLPPGAWASSDTVVQRRLVGREHTTEEGRQFPLGPLTEQEDIAKAELLEEAWGGVSDPLVGAQVDPTEQLPFPTGWMGMGVAKEIARAGVRAGRLTETEAVAFAADPTAGRLMVQERDDPGAEWWLDEEIEQAWWAEVGKKGGLTAQMRKERGRRALFGERGPTPEQLPEFGQMELGIAAKRTPNAAPKYIDWDAEPLGEIPDTELARELGVRPGAVLEARQKRGIAAVPPRARSGVDWDAEPLGQVSDAELARELGVHKSSVAAQRRKRGIPPAPPPEGIDWDAQPLGEITDAEIARQLGVVPQTVQEQRQKRGIPGARRSRIDWAAEPLGKVPDTVLGRELGIHHTAVWKERVRRGIPPFRPRAKTDAPEDNPARTFADSPNVGVVPWTSDPREGQTFTLVDPTRRAYLESGDYNQAVVAFLAITHNDEIPGLDSWMVAQAGARPGYGPLAYETALEYLRRLGPRVVLMPHVDVSEDATRVWEKFYERDYRELYPEELPSELQVHEEDALNRAYQLRVPIPGYDAAFRRGEAFVGQQAQAHGLWASEVAHLVMESGDTLFTARMKGDPG